MIPFPPTFNAFRFAWNPTAVKKKIIQTSRNVSSKVTISVPVAYRTQVITDTIRPPMTGAGIQNLLKTGNFFRISLPSRSASTAIIRV